MLIVILTKLRNSNNIFVRTPRGQTTFNLQKLTFDISNWFNSEDINLILILASVSIHDYAMRMRIGNLEFR